MTLTTDEHKACLAALANLRTASSTASLLAAVLPIIERSVWLRAAAVADSMMPENLPFCPISDSQQIEVRNKYYIKKMTVEAIAAKLREKL